MDSGKGNLQKVLNALSNGSSTKGYYRNQAKLQQDAGDSYLY